MNRRHRKINVLEFTDVIEMNVKVLICGCIEIYQIDDGANL